ncbi:NAD(P)H-dependent oxidoreductase [Paenibacillus sp. Leaf72]|uniref:NAD(P)H-dependent oxidoreductase n=1 Tax=Paenibacillus sp. Leaf72 TaxID=1736234 RepID=UPI0006F4D032|nr:NAD(P)H-dependent oxidoreductase [Paenibacillus sp. Leaf72]KQN97717.1 NAD(P)H-dependent oxidoreductase [Paenibacillus sp. Leaf72]
MNTEEKKQEILKAYEFRFACKNFDTAKQIPDNDFIFILETGRLSPSSFGLEPWKFVVVQDSALREKLRPVSSGAQGQLSTASHLLFVLARKQSGLRFDSPYVNKMMQDIQHMPEDIARFVSSIYKTFTETELQDDDQLIFEWACKQSYIAIGNMMTAAAQIGIDSCPIEGIDREKVAAIFEEEGIIHNNEFGVACLVAFGYRLEEPKRPKTRQILSDIVEWR